MPPFYTKLFYLLLLEICIPFHGTKFLQQGFSRLIFHELGKLSELKYSKTAYAQLYFHKQVFYCGTCENLKFGLYGIVLLILLLNHFTVPQNVRSMCVCYSSKRKVW